MANVLVVTEQRDGALRKTSHEVVWAARQLADAMGGTVDALVLGAPGVDAAGARLGDVGADRVLVAEDASFGRYSPCGYAGTAAAVVKAGGTARCWWRPPRRARTWRRASPRGSWPRSGPTSRAWRSRAAR